MAVFEDSHSNRGKKAVCVIPMSPNRATAVVSLCAVLSRILGFIRDVLLTQVLGTGPAADAFLAAFRLPNALRRIISEGGFNPAFIPHYSTLQKEDRTAAAGFATQACLASCLALIVLTVLGEFAARPIMLVLAGGLESEVLALAIWYFRLLLPLVLGSGLAAFLAAILNAERRIIATSLAPLIINLTLIAAIAAAGFMRFSPEASGCWIAVATGISGFLHLAILIFATGRQGFCAQGLPFQSSPHFKTLRRFYRGALPTLAAAGATQLFPLAAAQVASNTPSAISWFYYADRLFQLPAGLIAAAAGVVLLPQIARHHARGDRRACINAQNRALENALLIALPATGALAYLALPITVVLFQRGAFMARDSLETANLLLFLSLGLPFAIGGKIFASAVFATGRMSAAIIAGSAGLVATFVAAITLERVFAVSGIALGAVCGLIVYLGLLSVILWRKHLWRPDARLVLRCFRIVIATSILILGLATITRFIDPFRVAGLMATCFGGLLIYAVAAWLAGAVSRRDIKRYLR